MRALTVPVDEAVETGASRTSVEPDHDRVAGRVALRQHQVVEEAPLAALVHGHVPAPSGHTVAPTGIYRLQASEMDRREREGGTRRLPGVVLGGEGAMEAREAGDEVLLGRRDGRRPEERRHDDEEEEEKRGHGDPSSQLSLSAAAPQGGSGSLRLGVHHRPSLVRERMKKH